MAKKDMSTDNVCFGKRVMREEFVANLYLTEDRKEFRMSNGEGMEIYLNKENLGRLIAHLIELEKKMIAEEKP